jgi:hypothetical protein
VVGEEANSPLRVNNTSLSDKYTYNRQKLFDLRDEYIKNKMNIESQLDEQKFSPKVGFGLRTMKNNRTFHRNSTKIKYDKAICSMLCDLADVEATIDSIEHILEKSCRILCESADDSDAVSTTVSVHENVLDIGGQDPFFRSAGASLAPSIGQMEVLTISQFAERPVEIDTFELKTSTVLDSVYPVWDLISTKPSIRAKLKNFAYLRCNVKVRIAISGTPFHAGRILVSYQPYPLRNSTLQIHLTNYGLNAAYRPMLLTYLSQAAGALIMDVKANKPVEITLPFISTKPMHRLFNNQTTAISAATSFVDLDEAGSLFIWSINTVEAYSTTPPPISFQIYAWFEDIQLGTSTATQVAITTESKDERETGPLERISTALSVYTRALTMVPAIAPLARASTLVLGGIAGLSSWFGWSKPNIIEQPFFVKNRPFSNSCVTIGEDTVEKLSFDPLQELTVDPRVVGIDVDEMSIAHLSSIETYLTTFTWDSSDVPLAAPMWCCGVVPTLCNVSALIPHVFFAPTAMSFVASPFQYWRGSIKFRIEVVCSKFHRGKLAVFYEPNVDQNVLINADLSLNKNFMRIMDIQETESIEVIVNWAQPRAWNFVQSVTIALKDNFNTGNLVVPTNGYYNGYIGIVPFTTLQSPSADDSVSVNIYVSGVNLQFNMLTEDNLPTLRQLYSESADTHDPLLENTVTSFELNGSTSSSDGTCEYHFGEQPLSLRACLRRYVRTFSGTATSGATYWAVNLTSRSIQPATPSYGGGADTQPKLITYLPYAFLGVRGGMKKRVRFHGSSGLNAITPYVIVSNVSPFTAITPATTFSTSPGVVWQKGSICYVAHTNAGIEFEIPYYSNNLFQFSCSTDFIGTNGTGDMIPDWPKGYTCYKEEYGLTGQTWYGVETSAAAEDFMFMRYLGAPYFTITP